MKSFEYRVREFAELAGVTARALHHYDRLGLLRPKRSASGYRVYCSQDLERLEQIVALKFIGVPLKQIREVLDQNRLDLADALRRQRRVLEAKRCLLDRAIDAIRQAETVPNEAALRKIMEVMEMQNNTDWMDKYYSDESKSKLAEVRQTWSPELQERVSREWRELIAEVEASANEDPAGENGERLAERWISLIKEFTGESPSMVQGVKALFADRANWPSHFQQQMQPFRVSEEGWTFISRAMMERRNRGEQAR